MALGGALKGLKTRGDIKPDTASLQRFERDVADSFREVAKVVDRRVRPVMRANGSAQVGDIVPLDPSEGAFTVTLEPPGAESNGKGITLQNITSSTNIITVSGGGRANVDGAESKTIFGTYFKMELLAINGDWYAD